MDTDQLFREEIKSVRSLIDDFEKLLRERAALKTQREEVVATLAHLKATLEPTLAACFVVSSNKTMLRLDGEDIPMTADQRRDWISQQLAEDPQIKDVTARLTDLNQRIASYEDSATIAQMRYRAAVLEASGTIAIIRMGAPEA